MKDISLVRQGYRKLKAGYWAKPVGNNLFVVTVEKGGYKFTNYFYGMNDKLLVWDSKTIDEEEFESNLRYVERHTNINVGAYHDFSFISKEEYFNSVL